MNAVEEKHAAATKAKEYEFAGTPAAKDAELASAMQWTQGATEKLEQATAVVEELQNSMVAVRANAKHEEEAMVAAVTAKDAGHTAALEVAMNAQAAAALKAKDAALAEQVVWQRAERSEEPASKDAVHAEEVEECVAGGAYESIDERGARERRGVCGRDSSGGGGAWFDDGGGGAGDEDEGSGACIVDGSEGGRRTCSRDEAAERGA
jgi:hypothetical protein